MKKGRSRYDFNLSCDMNQANQLVQSYLNANGFKLIQKSGESFYRGGDALLGYWYFTYSNSGNVLTINAWVKGVFGELQLENEMTGALTIMPYRNSLNVLFQELGKLNSQNNGGNNMNNMPDNNMNNSINTNNNPINDMNNAGVGIVNNIENNNIVNNFNSNMNNGMVNNEINPTPINNNNPIPTNNVNNNIYQPQSNNSNNIQSVIEKVKGNKMLPIIIGGVVILLLVLGYFLFFGGKKTLHCTNTNSSNVDQEVSLTFGGKHFLGGELIITADKSKVSSYLFETYRDKDMCATYNSKVSGFSVATCNQKNGDDKIVINVKLSGNNEEEIEDSEIEDAKKTFENKGLTCTLK